MITSRRKNKVHALVHLSVINNWKKIRRKKKFLDLHSNKMITISLKI
jgi:hypothetical protein